MMKIPFLRIMYCVPLSKHFQAVHELVQSFLIHSRVSRAIPKMAPSILWWLARCLEADRQIPHRTGVDAHIAVRDLLTSDAEREAVASGKVPKNRTRAADSEQQKRE